MRRYLPMALVLATGCGAGVVSFRPTERVLAESPQGNAEAVYDLMGPQGRAGEAKIWTPGIRNEHGRAVVPVGIEIKNTGLIPISIELESLRLAGLKTTHGQSDVSVATTSVSGSAEVAARSVGDLGAVFTLPPGIEPRDVQEFRIEWTAQIGPETYAQFTPFVQSGDHRYYGDDMFVPFAPFYGELWMGYPFGWYGCPSWFYWECWPAYYYGFGSPYGYGSPGRGTPLPTPPRLIPRRPIAPSTAVVPPHPAGPVDVVRPSPGQAPQPRAVRPQPPSKPPAASKPPARSQPQPRSSEARTGPAVRTP